ncbi:MAG: 30S ribosomal protein S9 [Candidatus Nealsonbacteria bacterium]|nr:30S ribosomal protein S9 [Candidatus Nealsonbacteria bacterium]
MVKKTVKPASAKATAGKEKINKYLEATGRRKTASARVRLFTQGEKTFSVNGKPLENYFLNPELREIVKAPLFIMDILGKFGLTAKVKGGGSHSQAEAIRHGIARAIVEANPDFRQRLKKSGFLIRDPRMKERKKFGLKRARRAPQWSKR